MAMYYRYMVVETSRDETSEREETLWELGRASWEAFQVLPGSATDPNDATKVMIWLRKDASQDIGV